jgi:molybdopterin-biosynthesis enzyme MoeA-like protein
MKMADVPEGAVLVDNPVSAAPGFRMENVYVFAGVPRIMQAMFDNIRHELCGGEPIQSRSITVYLTEGLLAAGLADIQNTYPATDIGSYPMIRNGKLGTSLVVRSNDNKALDECYQQVKTLIIGLGGEIVTEESN